MFSRPLPLALLLLAMTLAACTEPARPTINLHRAVQIGDLDQVKRHLYWKTDINQPDANGDFPLHVAARTGSVPLAGELVAHGADPLAPNAAGDTPLEVALIHGKTQVALRLVGLGAPLDPQAMLARLVQDGVADRDVFNFLIRRGANVNLADADADAAGETLLHLAIAQGRLATVARLLAYGAEVNQPDGQGRLPLDLARAQTPHPDGHRIVRLLERNGARARNDAGLNPSITTPENQAE